MGTLTVQISIPTITEANANQLMAILKSWLTTQGLQFTVNDTYVAIP